MQVRILKITGSIVQSAKGRNYWRMEFVENQVKLKFASLKQAINFARENCYQYEIILPSIPKIVKKNYASNFR